METKTGDETKERITRADLSRLLDLEDREEILSTLEDLLRATRRVNDFVDEAAEATSRTGWCRDLSQPQLKIIYVLVVILVVVLYKFA
jgi:hypothetical protein